MAKQGKIGQNIKTAIHSTDSITFDRVESGEIKTTSYVYGKWKLIFKRFIFLKNSQIPFIVLIICLFQFDFIFLSENRGKIRA